MEVTDKMNQTISKVDTKQHLHVRVFLHCDCHETDCVIDVTSFLRTDTKTRKTVDQEIAQFKSTETVYPSKQKF